MGHRIVMSPILDAPLRELLRCQPHAPDMVHSDRGSQITGQEWQTFLQDHNLVSNLGRRGNCHDNAVAESFLQLL